MNNSNNKNWLIAVPVILVGIFTAILVGTTQATESRNSGNTTSDNVDRTNDGTSTYRENAPIYRTDNDMRDGVPSNRTNDYRDGITNERSNDLRNETPDNTTNDGAVLDN